MKTVEHIHDFLNCLVERFSTQEDVHAIALVVSYAHATARDDSDIDLVILTDRPGKYLESAVWAEQFGEIEKYQTEDYGKLISLRVWYRNSFEVEYGITTPDWAAQPLDAGTQQVIDDVMLVLFERSILLSPIFRIKSFLFVMQFYCIPLVVPVSVRGNCLLTLESESFLFSL